MLDPVPRRYTVCSHLFLPRCHRPSLRKEWVGFPRFVPRITTSRRAVFRGCRYSLMFRPPSLLSPRSFLPLRILLQAARDFTSGPIVLCCLRQLPVFGRLAYPVRVDSSWSLAQDHAMGSPVLPQFSLCACRRHYPGGAAGCLSLSSPAVAAFPVKSPGQPPHRFFSEACSTFTHITARTLAGSLNDPFHRRLQTARCLPACSDCYRLERPLPGGTCTLSRIVPFHGTRLHHHYSRS